ncbi:sigma-70 family RNA polymerase sigma factor [Paenibacillus aurantius]|uniref:Sigma-70 family RNA polymerase sigma factor n=1 Tax=Paenibacillus aurantius TaxID=2918900 RepID=A0AA96RCU5_9BACL|nr:sigma-70 family RNA polymerase sigma factor [Paenibacillus aurantius]WNQ10885.1 sigma-70 family RNA polymerase sigma factor [Paenibacillus aurantius]
MESSYLRYLAQAPDHDKDAILEELMNSYGNDVWNFAYFLTRRPDMADDLSQEVFLSVYHNLFRFRGDCSIKSWLLTITRNKVLKVKRSAFLRKVILVDYVIPGGHTRSAEAEMFDRADTRHIWQAVMQIPLRFREILLLHVHYQLNGKEMAELLGIPEATVKTRLYRARRKLEAILDKEKGRE